MGIIMMNVTMTLLSERFTFSIQVLFSKCPRTIGVASVVCLLVFHKNLLLAVWGVSSAFSPSACHVLGVQCIGRSVSVEPFF